ncbi:MAG TPA: energy transducer TonB [Pyrinomonadaceae bacterium]
MLCFLKRVLPFTLTLIVGLAIGSFFNLFSAKPQTEVNAVRLQSSYATGGGSRGCRSRSRSYAETYKSATILSKAEPAYTAEARRNRTEGDVTLRVTLGADGNVSNVETITSLPDGLTDQAIKAARQIKFVPATYNGSPADEAKTITYSFNLD